MNYTLTREEMQMARPGNIINAIKAVRARTNMGLKDAKDLVDDYVRNIERGVLPLVKRNDHSEYRLGLLYGSMHAIKLALEAGLAAHAKFLLEAAIRREDENRA